LTVRGGTYAGAAGNIHLVTPTTDTNGQILGQINFIDGTNLGGVISVRRATSTTTANILFYTNNGTSVEERMRISSGGNVGIGGANSYGKLDVGGQTNSSTNQEVVRLGNISGLNNGLLISVNTSNNYVYNFGTLGTGTVSASSGVLSTSSDMNLKIEDGFIKNGLNKVMKLKPRYFYWKEETDLPSDIRQLGFYAQEVNEALGEEVVNTPKDKNNKWGIYDRGMIAMLTKAIQEQQAQIEELKAKLS